MATWSGAIAQSSDDARQNGSTMNLTGSSINVSATTHHCGLRFVTDIPASSTISAATVDYNISTPLADSPDVTWSVQDADAGATFSSSSNDITSRTWTGSVTDTGTNVGTGWRTSPSLVTPVQAVVNRAGFTGVLVFKFTGNSSGEGVQIYTKDEGSNREAVLNVTYTPPGGVSKVARVRLTTMVGGKLTS